MKETKTESEYFEQIEHLHNLGQYASALQCADEGIERFPFSAQLYAARGEVFLSMKLFDKARVNHETAMQLGMQTLPILNNLGLCHLYKREYGPAIEYFTEALGSGKENVNTYLARAEAYYYSGRKDLARLDLEKAESLRNREAKDEQKTEICELHNELMKRMKVPVSYGLPAVDKPYFKAREKSFPNPNSFVWGGCIGGSIENEIEIAGCLFCRQEEKKWRQKLS